MDFESIFYYYFKLHKLHKETENNMTFWNSNLKSAFL